jgi:hypothetical protein
VRQAYDELARPQRLAVQLALAPATALAVYRFGPGALAAVALGAMALAECGRRRGGGRRVFPVLASVCAPAWVIERAVTSWAALALRLARGGVQYSHGRLRVAANPERVLRERHAPNAIARRAEVKP